MDRSSICSLPTLPLLNRLLRYTPKLEVLAQVMKSLLLRPISPNSRVPDRPFVRSRNLAFDVVDVSPILTHVVSNVEVSKQNILAPFEIVLGAYASPCEEPQPVLVWTHGAAPIARRILYELTVRLEQVPTNTHLPLSLTPRVGPSEMAAVPAKPFPPLQSKLHLSLLDDKVPASRPPPPQPHRHPSFEGPSTPVTRPLQQEKAEPSPVKLIMEEIPLPELQLQARLHRLPQ